MIARSHACPEREFVVDNLLVRIHFIIVMNRWTGLAPWELELPFPGSLTSTFLRLPRLRASRVQVTSHYPVLKVASLPSLLQQVSKLAATLEEESTFEGCHGTEAGQTSGTGKRGASNLCLSDGEGAQGS